ncbi:carbohydrate ABC transporter permease [Myceligenerans pegani]|uniref:Sugar ABC transporter permease n=1 Tax=Myceligenerans pegani TaxID=2776917 RepID=A0ABR9N091_9MICO|nr:sugar ABC transporter permease [Myceligenerans sp. TRM 65318]MBE1876579.1 sugar ABC transporter permease [Myceligenerans sp. TRM 65318]MBE3018850.1 sugar ABC transporter permease [Myceligenerans sp. TRM 65318]
MGPVLALQITFLFLPLGNTFVLAFTNASTIGGGSFTGLDNFVEIFSSPVFWEAAGHTGLYVLLAVPAIVCLSLFLAILVNTRMRGTGVVRPILFSPLVMPMAVVALMFQYVLSSDGLVNQVLRGLSIVAEPVPFLTSSRLALLSAILVTIWKSCGLYTLILLAALQNVSRELDEAAELDGASWSRRTWSVTIPQIRGTVVLVAILSAIAALRVFTEPFVLTGGGPGTSSTTVVLYLFSRGISPGTQAGFASAVSLVLFAAVLLVSALGWSISRRSER